MFSSTGMNRGGWREGPKKGTKEKLEDLTADLKITLVNLNERERELKKRRKEIEKLSRENVLLREESAAFIEEDKEEEEEDRRESYGRKKGNQLPDGLRTLVLKLYKMRLSTEQVRSVLAGMMEEMNIDEFQTPSYGTLVALRSDLGPVCDVRNSRCASYIYIFSNSVGVRVRVRCIRTFLLILNVAGGTTYNVKVYHSVVSCSQYQSNTISPTF